MPALDEQKVSEARSSGLTLRMRPTAMAGLLARQMSALCVMALVPAIIALADGQLDFSLRLAIVTGALAMLSLGGWRLPVPDDLRTHEALAVIALTYLLGALAMAWPFMALQLNFIDALFEVMSGLTTTGFSLVLDIGNWPASAQLARGWLQWFGGLAILIAAVAIILPQGTAALRLGLVTLEEETILASMRQRAQIVFQIYLVLTLACFLAAWAASDNAVGALSLTFSTVSTGGFSLNQESLANAALPLSVTLAIFAILGAIPIDHYQHLRRGQFARFFTDVEISTLVVMIFLGAAALVLCEWFSGREMGFAALYELFYFAASGQSTTGLSTAAAGDLAPASKLVLIFLMTVGGCMGSTAGGIKIFRFRLGLSVVRTLFRRTAVGRHTLTPTRVGRDKIDRSQIEAFAGITLLFLTAQMASWLIFVGAGYPPLDALFDVVSAISTVGLSTGVVTPDLPDSLKLVLIADMWLGRLELLAVLVLLVPAFWIKRS